MGLKLNRLVACVVALSVLGLGIVEPAQAALIGTTQLTVPDGQRDRERIAATLARPEIQARLQELGVEPADAQMRVAALTDAEAAAIAGKIDSLPAGGIIGALVFIFLVLLVTDILGLTKVYPFTRPIKR